MEGEKKRGGWWALIAVTVGPIAVLLGAYAAAYYALAEHPLWWTKGPMYRVEYGWKHDLAIAVFAPMHRIDVWIRPKYWDMDQWLEALRRMPDYAPASSGEPVNPPAPSDNPPEISN